MTEDITSRFGTLLEEARRLEGQLEYTPKRHLEYMVPSERLVAYQTWMTSTANLLSIVTLPASPYRTEIERLLTHEHMQGGIPTSVFQRMEGLLISAKQEWDAGLLRQVEYIVAAETFDDFLDHASAYHRGNKKNEASVLAAAVLEDTLKKIAKRHNVDPSGLALEELIDTLVKSGVFTPVKAKRYKSEAAVRNPALHAEWDKIDIKDVGKLIDSTRELIQEYL